MLVAGGGLAQGILCLVALGDQDFVQAVERVGHVEKFLLFLAQAFDLCLVGTQQAQVGLVIDHRIAKQGDMLLGFVDLDLQLGILHVQGVVFGLQSRQFGNGLLAVVLDDLVVLRTRIKDIHDSGYQQNDQQDQHGGRTTARCLLLSRGAVRRVGCFFFHNGVFGLFFGFLMQ